MIVVDASALIALLEPTDALHDVALERFVAVDGRGLAISPITHAEVLAGPARSGTLDVVAAALSGLGIKEVPLPADAAPRLALLRAETWLKLPDCCVLMAAQQSAGVVLSFDARLVTAARTKGIDAFVG